MKKIKWLLGCFGVFVLFFCLMGDVKANSISDINMSIYIDSNGNAHVTEKWSAYMNQGTEGYHPYYNLGNSTITDFRVSDESNSYTTLSSWDVDASFDEKKYKSGIHYISDGVELCFGISSYGNNTYTLSYTINDFIYQTADNYQMLYWTLFPKNFSVSPSNVSIKIYADQRFHDSLDVWGYGNYGGTAYVYDGIIEMNSDGNLSADEYMTLLVKFPANTFNIVNNSLDKDFNHYYEMAEDGATHYNQTKPNPFFVILTIIFTIVFPFIIMILIVVIVCKVNKYPKVGTRRFNILKGDRNLTKKYEYFRDIPCNKDIFRAYWVAEAYSLNKKKTDFLGAILLKWTKEKFVSIRKMDSDTIFKKEDTTIVFNSSDKIENQLEKELYDMMFEASQDGILESREFEKWCDRNYSKILGWFDKVIDYETEQLCLENKCKKDVATTFKVFKTTVYDVDGSMKEEAEQLAGLKRFLTDFSSISEKYPIEVMMWEEYLMFAQILGIAEQVAKDFKKLYPNEITDVSVNEVLFIHNISYSGMQKATTARDRANSYSSGGGGFSSGGGGGGSFGGGGGGGGFR